MTYTNPRTRAVIDNWPNGGSKRCTALFTIERDPKNDRERAVRTTGGAPKKLTYARKARIVDGDDGRTYIAELTAFGFISIMRGDMRFEHETIHMDDPRYIEARPLFGDGWKPAIRPGDAASIMREETGLSYEECLVMTNTD